MKENRTERREKQSVSTAPEVVYTQPEPLNRKKLMLRLLTVCAVVLALFVGFSIFFRVETVEVLGNQQYTVETVLTASGIEDGASLLTFGKGRASARIMEALPYVESVRISIKLPGTVRIIIDEVGVVYSIQDSEDRWWFMTSEGQLVEQVTASRAAKETIINGVKLLEPQVGKQAVAMEIEEEATYVDDDESQTVVTVTNAERLQTALEILTQLELNEILGEVSQVDVTDMGDIFLWYGTKTKILLGDPGKIDDKIATMKAVVDDNRIDSTGIVDLSELEENKDITITPFE